MGSWEFFKKNDIILKEMTFYIWDRGLGKKLKKFNVQRLDKWNTDKLPFKDNFDLNVSKTWLYAPVLKSMLFFFKMLKQMIPEGSTLFSSIA